MNLVDRFLRYVSFDTQSSEETYETRPSTAKQMILAQELKKEMEAIVFCCRERQIISKVIFENAYLEQEEMKALCEIAREVQPDFIKTSTGFAPSGAKMEDVRLMKQWVGDTVKVKAAGGIRSWETCALMIDAGAERIGTSASLAILAEFEESRRTASYKKPGKEYI